LKEAIFGVEYGMIRIVLTYFGNIYKVEFKLRIIKNILKDDIWTKIYNTNFGNISDIPIRKTYQYGRIGFLMGKIRN